MPAQKNSFVLQLLTASREILKREMPKCNSFKEIYINWNLPDSTHRIQINTENCTLVVSFKGHKVSRIETNPHEPITIEEDKLSIIDHMVDPWGRHKV